ncbi:MAG: type III-B CRISPR module RAMP protein Cmr4 [Clostridiales bacterium]|nr:type III-B CRISPR module RAMP protein Cmr4 [Clostridiales bacterium]
MKDARVVFVHALSPLHAGIGQGVGTVDLPIARERATGIPYLPGSSLKGSLRDRAKEKGFSKDAIKTLFGPDTSSAHEHAGSLVVGDVRLLLFPVRSLAGVFAYGTSPFLLKRFQRDLREAEVDNAGEIPEAIPTPSTLNGAYASKESILFAGEKKVYLEDLDLEAQAAAEVTQWERFFAARTRAPVKGRLLIVHDDLMGFLLETATEVVARVRIEDEKKTVARRALWYEEHLPAESLLYTLVLLAPVAANGAVQHGNWTQVQDLFSGVIQLGGKASVGRGLCTLSWGV